MSVILGLLLWSFSLKNGCRESFGVSATSVKMDYMTMAMVRTDPIVTPTPNTLSNHLHTFFGPTVAKSDTSYADLRAATGNTGNVIENQSLYWYPTIYRYHPSTQKYTIADVWFSSAYYVWTTGQATAFPDGFKMIAGGSPHPEKAKAECVTAGSCPNNDCTTLNSFFPATSCAELEISLQFPECWDGVNLDSSDHRSHVEYANNDTELCPSSHPVKIPRIFVFTRLRDYPGGQHLFSDGTGFFHSDYFSGWNATFLQSVLDTCNTASEGPNPDSFCEGYLSFRDAPKTQKEDDQLVAGLQSWQPSPPFDTTTITTEAINNVAVLPGDPTGVLNTLSPTITFNPTRQPSSMSPSQYVPPTPSPTAAPTTTQAGGATAGASLLGMPLVAGAVVLVLAISVPIGLGYLAVKYFCFSSAPAMKFKPPTDAVELVSDDVAVSGGGESFVV